MLNRRTQPNGASGELALPPEFPGAEDLSMLAKLDMVARARHAGPHHRQQHRPQHVTAHVHGTVEALPIRTRILKYPYNLAMNVITKVLPENMRRIRLIIPNVTGGTLFLGFDAQDCDIPILNNTTYMEQIGSIVVDNIYLKASVAGRVNIREGVQVK